MREFKNEARMLGLTVYKCCEILLREFQDTKEPFFFVFNEIKITVDEKSTFLQLVRDFEEKQKIGHEKYIQSKEYKDSQKRNLEEITQMSESLNTKVKELENLNFSSFVDILDWVRAIQPLTDRVGVNTPVEVIVEKFSKNGYFPGVNTGEDFAMEDPDNCARYIIGQALDNIINVGAIHRSIPVFVRQWRELHYKK